jgi:hypothetical protein
LGGWYFSSTGDDRAAGARERTIAMVITLNKLRRIEVRS